MANSSMLLVDTSLHTHLAMLLTSHDTLPSLKRKIEAEHLLSYPQTGPITVQAVEIWREGCMYRLSMPDSSPVYAAFDGINGYWRLSVKAMHDRNLNLASGRDGPQLRVSNGGLVVREAPNIDEELSLEFGTRFRIITNFRDNHQDLNATRRGDRCHD